MAKSSRVNSQSTLFTVHPYPSLVVTNFSFHTILTAQLEIDHRTPLMKIAERIKLEVKDLPRDPNYGRQRRVYQILSYQFHPSSTYAPELSSGLMIEDLKSSFDFCEVRELLALVSRVKNPQRKNRILVLNPDYGHKIPYLQYCDGHWVLDQIPTIAGSILRDDLIFVSFREETLWERK